MHDNYNIPSDDDDMEDDELINIKWKLNLSERARHSSSRKARRKDWIKLLYLSSLSPEEILHDKRGTGTSRWRVTTTSFLIKNMEASESAVSDPHRSRKS